MLVFRLIARETALAGYGQRDGNCAVWIGEFVLSQDNVQIALRHRRQRNDRWAY